MRKFLSLLTGLLVLGSVSYGQIATKVKNGLVRTSDSLNETRPGYVLIPAAGKALKVLIDANTAALAGKQNTITSSTDLVANSITVATLNDSDSTRKVATTDWVRRYVLRTMPTFFDFPYRSSQFTFSDSLAIRPDFIRGLISVSGTGASYNPSTGVLTFTGGGGGTSGPWSTSGSTAYYSAGPVGIGTNVPRKLFDVNGTAVFTTIYVRGQNDAETDANVLENAAGSGIRIRGGFIHNANTIRHEGNGNYITDGNTFIRALGRDDRAIFVNPGGVSIGNGTNTATATVDVTGTLKTSGTAQVGGQLTAPSIKFANDNSVMASAPATVCSSLAELAAATTRLVIYDGSHWVRVSGNVGTDPGANNFYFATQYNSGSDHYERQFMGRAKFEWWKPSSSNTWEQLKYATNSRLPIQIANGDYYFNQLVYITPGTQVYGHSTSPDSVRFHINGSTPQLFTSWYWFDGNVAGKKAENIVFDGFTLYQESSYVAKRDTNDFYGPIAIDGGGSFNNVIRNIKYKQVSTTAIVNAIVVKMGAQRPCDGLLIDNVQSLTSTVKGRMLVEVLNQGDRNAGQPERIQVPAKNVEIRNCVADGFRFGISIAGYFDKPYVHHNIVRNCTDYGVEFAGPLVGGRCEFNGFGGTQNVLIAGNYYADQTADWVFPVGTGQRYIGNFTEGKVTGGYVEIRSGGTIDFSDNNFQIDGGVLLQNTTFAGVRGGQFTRNRIISTMTNSNWRGQAKAILLMNGATGLDVSNNYLERGGTDADALIQSNANGVSSVSNRFYNNVYQVGTNGTYYGNTSTTAVRFNNFDVTGTARN